MQAIQATFEDGVLKPLEPLRLPEGFEVTLWLDPDSKEMTQLRDEDRAFLNELAQRRSEVFRRLGE